MPTPVISQRFGRIVCDDEVENELLARITDWVLAYQAEVERQRGWDARTLEAPASIIPMTLLDRQPEDAFPCIAVSVSGSGAASSSEDRELSMEWSATVTVWAMGADDADTRKRVGAHVAAVRALVSQQGGRGPLVANTGRPTTEYTMTAQDQASGRTIGAGIITFSVGVEGMLSELAGGMSTPPIDPYATVSGLGEVVAVNVTVGPL